MSMISAQIDELRRMADGQVTYRDARAVMLQAADTIWELRDDLQRANAENAKLRELVDGLRYCANESHGHGRCNVRFIDGYVTCCPLYDVDSDTARCEALLRELGVEVE